MKLLNEHTDRKTYNAGIKLRKGLKNCIKNECEKRLAYYSTKILTFPILIPLSL